MREHRGTAGGQSRGAPARDRYSPQHRLWTVAAGATAPGRGSSTGDHRRRAGRCGEHLAGATSGRSAAAVSRAVRGGGAGRSAPVWLPCGDGGPDGDGDRRCAAVAGISGFRGQGHGQRAACRWLPALVAARHTDYRADRHVDGVAGGDNALCPEPLGCQPDRSGVRYGACRDRRSRHALAATHGCGSRRLLSGGD